MAGHLSNILLPTKLDQTYQNNFCCFAEERGSLLRCTAYCSLTLSDVAFSALNSHRLIIPQSGNSNLKGSLSTVHLLIKVACFVKRKENKFNTKKELI